MIFLILYNPEYNNIKITSKHYLTYLQIIILLCMLMIIIAI